MKYYKDENNQVYAYEDDVLEFGSYVEVETVIGGEPILDENGQVIIDENGEQLTTEKSTVIEKVYNEVTVKDGLTKITEDEALELAKRKLTNEDIISQNESTKAFLLSEAVNQISLLQDAIDLDMQEEASEEQLKEWKKYRVLLTRINTSLGEMALPEKPK